MLQLILSREVEVASRPNLLAVYPAVSATESGHETRLLCSLLKEGESEPENVGFVTVDHLPSNGSWPDRQNRKRLAYTAARSIVARARSANADIVIGEVSGIKRVGVGLKMFCHPLHLQQPYEIHQPQGFGYRSPNSSLVSEQLPTQGRGWYRRPRSPGRDRGQEDS